jgi:NAD(P)-dependent dehydrogenase (short-subunit alcohol dehydrogenase family)
MSPNASGTATRAALIFGMGSGISASLARTLSGRGWKLALASRHPDRFAAIASQCGAVSIAADAADPADVERCFAEADRTVGALDLVVFNPSYRTRGPFLDLDPKEVDRTIRVGAYGGFLVAQAAARRMVPRGTGAIFFTGASASVKGYAQSAPFAMAKFALRGLAQSMARELQPKGIHVAHFVIDGGVRSPERGRVESAGDTPDSLLDPDAIAASYLHVLDQPRSAWTSELELRPWVERF